MAAYTEQVRRNSPYTPAALHRAPIYSASVIPDQVGQPCPIKHVLYIIKENRTYDQVFGDMKDAAGKPIETVGIWTDITAVPTDPPAFEAFWA